MTAETTNPMNIYKHTPKPWIQNMHPSPGNQLFVKLGTGSANAVIERQSVLGKVTDEDLANARLIAAAPDLLEALENVIAHVDQSHPRARAACVLAFAAIAKAT